MDDSSDGSPDEEEIFKNFDEEAKKIVQTGTYPKKSADRYVLVYNTYKKWREENKKSLSTSEENNLIVYFEGLKAKLKPPTLWSVWSMLKTTLSANENININNFLNLKSMIKTNSKAYKPRKAFVLRWDQIMKFMKEAPDYSFLAMKAIMIFGICGCLRCDEITNLKVGDVEDLDNKYLVSINENKNDYGGQFIIGNLFYDTIKKYISLRPAGKFSDQFFIKYSNGTCSRQPIGRHTIGAIPEKIASYLNLPNSNRYTGHCFRRTSATLLSDSGANMQMIKQLGRWRSDIIAQGYIENSMHNREMIYNGVIQKPRADIQANQRKLVTQKSTNIMNIEPKPSTSAQTTIDRDDNSLAFDLNAEDFEDDFTIDDVDQAPITKVVPSGFTTAKKVPILVPVTNRNDSNIVKKQLFTDKPGIELIFNNQSTVQPATRKKQKMSDDLETQKLDNVDAMPNKHAKFENCTFNNCVFNITVCNCNKENKA